MEGSRVAVVAGFVLYLAAGVLVLFGGLIMPIWAVAALGVVWVLGLLLAVRWRDRPARVLVLPFLSAGLWFLVAWLGDTFLDWTA